ncbi:MAG TPA: AraC family transcriptional regulator [Stellaceae bacterium]|jgi:AraC-like DNA-binding protein|nr:AraC family transcriptional regulator [Stellaceae bacterium]
MDALSDVLRVTRLSGGVFLHAEFSAPWCIATRLTPELCAPVLGPAAQLIVYHYVVEGELRLRVEGEGGNAVTLGAGEVALLPRNDLHLMGSDLGLPPVPGREVIQPPEKGGLFTIRHGGNGARTRMVCGFLGCDDAERNPVISTLPAVLKLDLGEDGAARWVRSTFWYAAEEIAAGRPGSDAVLAKVSELLFVEAVRRYAEGLPEGQTGWLAGLRDPYVARALALVHRDIARPWTVTALGRAVGLSRSALAERFIHLIGMPPMHYLASWRMQVAMQELRNTGASLARVAEMVGYESEAAFSRAFKKTVGTAPATWRRARV